MSADQIETEIKKGIEDRATEKDKPAWIEIELPKGDLTITKDWVVGGVRVKASKVNMWKVLLETTGIVLLIEQCRSDDAKPRRHEGDAREAAYGAWQMGCASGGSCEPFRFVNPFEACIKRAFSYAKKQLENRLTTKGAEAFEE
jgi:hypothetical protein